MATTAEHRGTTDQAARTVVVGRRPHRLQPFEAAIGLIGIYAGLSHFIRWLAPTGPATVVELHFPRLVPVWSLMYALGGILMIWGLARRCAQFEGAGLCLLAGGLAVALTASLSVGAPVLPTMVGLGSLTAACVGRVAVLWRSRERGPRRRMKSP